MKRNFGRIAVALLIGFAVVLLLRREKSLATNASTPRESPHDGVAQATRVSSAPFVVQDTENDSPGTNSVTRIVTLKARIGGEPAPELQWKVDKGNGFVEIRDATNATYCIGNAQIED